MRNYLYYFVLITSIISTYNRKQFQFGNTEYALRLTNVSDCPHSNGDPFFIDVKLNTYGNTQYINGKINIANDFCSKMISVKINRCLNYNYACEYFQTWNVSEPCAFVKMKISMWRPFHDAIKPSTWANHCPCFNKGTYDLINATMGVKEVVKFYSEATRYYWQIWAKNIDRYNQMQECIYVEFHIISYNSKIPVTSKQ